MAKYTKNKNKKTLKYGGETAYNGNPISNTQKNNPYTSFTDENGTTHDYDGGNSQKGLSTNQYIGAGTAAIGGGINYYNTYNNPNSTVRDQQNAASNTVSSTAGAINPIVGGIIGGVNMIAKPIRNNAEQTNIDGTLKNKSLAEGQAIGGATLDPIGQALPLAMKGIWTPKQYTNNLESENKNKIANQKTEQDNYNTQQTNYQNQQNQFIQNSIESTLANQNKPKNTTSYDGNPQYGRYGGKMYEMGGNLNKGTSYQGFEHDDTNPENINEGVPIGQKNIVEKGEYRPSKNSKNSMLKDYIFSDKLFIKR